MKITGLPSGAGLYCDTGRNAGMMRIDIVASVYLTEAEYELYQQHGLDVSVAGRTQNYSRGYHDGRRDQAENAPVPEGIYYDEEDTAT